MGRFVYREERMSEEKLGVGARTFNTQEAEAGGSAVWCQPRPHRECQISLGNMVRHYCKNTNQPNWKWAISSIQPTCGAHLSEPVEVSMKKQFLCFSVVGHLPIPYEHQGLTLSITKKEKLILWTIYLKFFQNTTRYKLTLTIPNLTIVGDQKSLAGAEEYI